MEKEQLLKNHFLSLYCMVLADGVVSPKEMESLYNIGRTNYNLSEKEINEAIVASGTTYAIPTSPEECVKILYEMAIIAWADNNIDDNEIRLLHTYALRFGVNECDVPDFVNFLLDKAQNQSSEEDVIKELTA